MPDHDQDLAVDRQPRLWKSPRHALTFTVFALLGFPIMAAAWLWLNLASLEEATEQPKALAAGTTMAGTTLLLGGIPLIVAHALGVVILSAGAGTVRGSRRSAVVAAVVAVGIASAVGVTFVLIVNGGQLLTAPLE
jgi:hypothetical protein